jgi:hypothetical protein
MALDSESTQLDAYLRDWLAHSSGFFVDPSVRFASDLRGAPLGAPSRRMALPAGAWVLLEKQRLPFVLAGIERRGFEGRECYLILEFCVTGASRVSFWERAAAGDWEFLRDTSAYGAS